MPEIVHLDSSQPQVFTTAKYLAALSDGTPIDLSDVVVIIPTAGAGRKIRERLVHEASARGVGLLPPQMLSPMGFVQREVGAGSTRSECLAAWMEALMAVAPSDFPDLLGKFRFPLEPSAALRISKTLHDLCQTLAEGGWTPASREVAAACAFEEDRWRQIGQLYRRYLAQVKKSGGIDPNESAILGLQAAPAGIRHVVVAGVPDLIRLTQRELEKCERWGLRITVLVYGSARKDVDAWGRPDPGSWKKRLLEIPMEDVLVCADAESEAAQVAALRSQGGRPSLVAAEPSLVGLIEFALLDTGQKPFNPEGLPLARFEPARLLDCWLRFRAQGRMEDLRPLLELPAFLNLIKKISGLETDQTLLAYDRTCSDGLFGTISDAERFLGNAVSGVSNSADFREAARLFQAVAKLMQKHEARGGIIALKSFLLEVYDGVFLDTESAEAGSLGEISHLLDVIGRRLPRRVEVPAGEELLRDAIATTVIYGKHTADDVEINGWLEAPWLAGPSLLISGCVEGSLPSSIDGHPFLPDSVRGALGLANNEDRLARDMFLMQGLLDSHPRGSVKFTLSRLGADSEPCRPSRLFFRCDDTALAGRVRRLFTMPDPSQRVHARAQAWKLELGRFDFTLPVKISVTSFRDYLTCPVRYAFKHVIRMKGFESGRQEMDALDYGIVLHKVLENFAKDPSVRESTEPREIMEFVSRGLDGEFLKRYGEHPPMPVRVQLESLRARLRAFAEIQALQFREGWRIEEAEYRIEDEALMEGLTVRASLDRVEINIHSGQRRILDYKTYSTKKEAADTHFQPISSHPLFPEMVTGWNGREKLWKDLQLPLYLALAGHAWNGDKLPATVGYFLLPARVEDSCIAMFSMDESLKVGALSCAREIASRVRAGCFWPPRTLNPKNDDFASFFLGEDPEKFLSPDAILLLKGGTP